MSLRNTHPNPLRALRAQRWTLQAIPRSQRLESPNGFGGAAISPSLALVESFDYLDGSPGVLRGVGNGTVASQANWIFYDQARETHRCRRSA